jgi:hypothetical protein
LLPISARGSKREDALLKIGAAWLPYRGKLSSSSLGELHRGEESQG